MDFLDKNASFLAALKNKKPFISERLVPCNLQLSNFWDGVKALKEFEMEHSKSFFSNGLKQKSK